jgi:hypothetical protein
VVHQVDDGARTPDGRDRVERVLERIVILFAKAMVALVLAVLVYGFLVMSFFVFWGPDVGGYLDPRRSPLGAAVTVVVIWPVVGFLCLAVLDKPRDRVRRVKKFAKAAWHAVRRGAEA